MMDDLALEAKQVGVERAGRSVLRGFDLALRSGEVVSLVGPNGAGKSSAIKALAGLWPHTGAIVVRGKPLGAYSLRERARTLTYVPQQSLMMRGLSVREVVRQGRYAHDPSWPGLRTRVAPAVETSIALTQLEALADRPWHELSGGEQRRVLLARALATEAPIILMDEPTTGLDIAHALRFLALVHTLARAGRAIVLVLHDLEQVRRHSDLALLLDRGDVVASGPTAEVITADRVRAVYGVELEERAAPAFRLRDPA